MKEQTGILQSALDKVRDQIETLERALDVKPDAGFGRGDPAIVRREVDRALLERLCERAETLKKALSETSQGTCGICEQCGNAIHPDRLAVLPDTRVCVRCALAGQHTSLPPRSNSGDEGEADGVEGLLVCKSIIEGGDK